MEFHSSRKEETERTFRWDPRRQPNIKNLQVLVGVSRKREWHSRDVHTRSQKFIPARSLSLKLSPLNSFHYGSVPFVQFWLFYRVQILKCIESNTLLCLNHAYRLKMRCDVIMYNVLDYGKCSHHCCCLVHCLQET